MAAYELPGYWELERAAFRKELQLSPEQEKKLREISTHYHVQQEMSAPIWLEALHRGPANPSAVGGPEGHHVSRHGVLRPERSEHPQEKIGLSEREKAKVNGIFEVVGTGRHRSRRSRNLRETALFPSTPQQLDKLRQEAYEQGMW